ncbi:MAG: hypothetical protein ACI39R_08830 [Lachnospiraceae bacterium]
MKEDLKFSRKISWKYLLIGAICVLIVGAFLFSICENDSDLPETPIETDNFSLRVFNRFSHAQVDKSSGIISFEASRPTSALQIQDMSTNNTELKAYIDFYKSMLIESYGITENEINIAEISDSGYDSCYYFTYQYTKDNTEYIALNYMICDEGQVLLITESGLPKKKDVLESEIKLMADSVEYIGSTHLPNDDDYPFTVANDSIRITVNKGFSCPTIAKNFSSDKSEYITDRPQILIEYRYADSFDKGSTSRFTISLSDNQDITVAEQAENLHNNYSNNDSFYISSMYETTLGNIVSAESDNDKVLDPNIADITAYIVHLDSKKINQIIENIYFEIDAQIYLLTISYPHNDEKTRDELREILCSVEFLTEE